MHFPGQAAHSLPIKSPPSFCAVQMTVPKDFSHDMPKDFLYNQWYFSGYSVFSSGLSVGLTNIASG